MASLTIAVTVQHTLPAKFLKSFLAVLLYSSQKFHPVNVTISTNSFIDESRNVCVKEALKNNSDYLFFLDADVLAPSDIVEKLAARGKDIISGPYHHKVPPYVPHAYTIKDDGWETYKDIDADKLYEVDAVGAGCLLIKRNVLEALKEPYFDFYSQGKKIGEDFYFCRKAKQQGFGIWYDNAAGTVRHIGAAVGFGDYQVWNYHVKRGEIRFFDTEEK